MKTIKIIDLLNKIANDENVPKEIKVSDKIYFYDETDSNEFYRYRTHYEEELLTDYCDLNDEVEIIEEDKKIEKIKIDDQDRIQALSTGNYVYKVNQPTKNIIYKINEIIDYLMENKQ